MTQRQLEDEYHKRVVVIVDDCVEWVHVGVTSKATLRAFEATCVHWVWIAVQWLFAVVQLSLFI